MEHTENYQEIRQTLQELPAFSFKHAQGERIGEREKQEEQECCEEAHIIAQPVEGEQRRIASSLAAQKKQQCLAILDIAAQDQYDVQTARDACPDANVASEIDIHRIATLAQQIERPDQKGHANQQQTEIAQRNQQQIIPFVSGNQPGNAQE